MRAAFAAALVSMISQVASAQTIDKTQLALKAAESRQASQQAVKAYSWKSRTELMVEEEVRSVRIETIRYDIDGKQQKTLLQEQTLEEKQKRGLRGKLQEKKAEKAKDWGNDLAELLQRYVTVTKGQLVDFFDKAKFTPEGQAVRIEGHSLLLACDRVTYWVDTQQQRPTRIQVETVHQGDPVRLVIDFRSTTDSLTYPARAVVSVPAKQVQLKIENFEYAKS